MPRPKYKQRCALCKNNMVVMYSGKQFPICSECQMKRIQVPIKDPKWEKFFNIPTHFYEESQFLRNIKEAYIRFENLTEKQIEVFKKVVKDMKAGKYEEDD
jgi:hypothetical protein